MNPNELKPHTGLFDKQPAALKKQQTHVKKKRFPSSCASQSESCDVDLEILITSNESESEDGRPDLGCQVMEKETFLCQRTSLYSTSCLQGGCNSENDKGKKEKKHKFPFRFH